MTDFTPPPPRILPFKSEPGKRYRPSNGSEGRYFESMFCVGCKHDHAAHYGGDYENGCHILAEALAFEVDDENYPKQWVIHDDGYPTCTAFDPDGCS